ncbi:MAG: hypothetical protein JRG91_08480 [Deltaproteobacteria bacterium]|nr:hypothetical protein [Deltaproteobacteria bacterium]
MNADCDLCHTSGDGRDPYIGSSNGTSSSPGYGCTGCHGGMYSGSASGVGLRLHHTNNGIAACAICHSSDPAPHPESTAPPYYGVTADSNVDYPCNDDSGTSEDWAGDSTGLDNDGDNAYDLLDSDCASVPVCGNSIVETGEDCDDGNGSNIDACLNDCTDASCGDSYVWTGVEDCDDGNLLNTDSCLNSCVDASCGDTYVWSGVEDCDDGNLLNTDGCLNSCLDASCGDTYVWSGVETCDPPSACPSSCDDGDACTTDVLSGDPSTCDSSCTFPPIVSCVGGDGCCPGGCDSSTDSDCTAVCGNSIVESGEDCDDGNGSNNDACLNNCTDASCGDTYVWTGVETCDPPGSCPTACDDGDLCTTDVMTGDPSTCDATCTFPPIVSCVGGDGCCPGGCDSTTDSDCGVSICGNGTIDLGETCDPPGSCPTSCDDGNGCTVDTLSGDPSTCDVVCSSVSISSCTDGDGCCPAGCSRPGDRDCSPSCGNGSIGGRETCDPPSSCPTSCDDGDVCTEDIMTGSSINCNVDCSSVAIVTCIDGDGCCPAGCDFTFDDDCSATCGNGIIDSGETCDPPSSCPTSCDDGLPCTTDVLSGDSTTCDAACTFTPITVCTGGDGCCASGCDATTDTDCPSTCGNGVIEPGETCDPPSSCPTSCDDGLPCTVDTLTGSSTGCTSACSFAPITACIDGDGCCAPGCDETTDDDCPSTCGNGVIETGETCDPPDTCPTDCDDGVGCTIDTLTGSSTSCTAACSNTPIVACTHGDGCCPAGCDSTVDDDCSVSCGNGVVESGETCDPPDTCPSDCDDADDCTFDTLTGSSVNCNVACTNTLIVECSDGDGCCPFGCDATLDADCSMICGNGVVEDGETCDPPSTCPTTCDDLWPCSEDLMTGSMETCDVTCAHTTIFECVDGDGCCPDECDDLTDDDCLATCGDGVLGPGETCDPPETCETSCDDLDECTADLMSGSARTCDVSCESTVITECVDDDGCCPVDCTEETDTDCAENPSGRRSTGCGCSLTGGGGPIGLLVLTLLALWAVALQVRRRRTRR